MAKRGSVFMSLIASANLKGLEDVQKKLREVGKTSRTTNSALGGFGKALGGIASVTGAIALGTKALKEAQEAFQVTRTTEQILKNTGLAASVTATQIGDLADQISNLTGLDDEQVQAASNVLLGFKGLIPAGKDAAATLSGLTSVAVDLGARLKTDSAGGAKVLGKALADPAKGVAALYRAGLALDKQTSDRIKLLSKEGKLQEARQLLLQNLASTTQGFATATVDPLTRVQNAFNNMLEAVGTPVLEAFGQIARELTPALRDMTPTLIYLGKLFAALIATAVKFKDQLLLVGKILVAVWAGTKIYAGIVKFISAIKMLITVYKALRTASLGAAVAQALATRGISLVGLLGAGGVITATLAGFDKLEKQFKATEGALPDLTGGISDAAANFETAAQSLYGGVSAVSSAAQKAGKTTNKVKPKTATSAKAKTMGDQSFTVAGSGGGLSLSVTVNGSVVQERDIARTIRDELLQFARRQGANPAFGV